jgi:hypothetical protein
MRTLLTILLLALLAVSCSRGRQTAATAEVESVCGRFPQYAEFVRTNHDALEQLAADIQAQQSFKRIIWSLPPEYFTVIRRDDRIIQGALTTNDWAQDARTDVETWVARLNSAGCKGGFDDQGINWGLRLYLDVNVYIGIPATSNTRLVEQYEAWSVKGRDVRGDACVKLDKGWYLCSERR